MPHTVEGIARVVKVEDGVAWFEPEQTTSCGHCASSAACGASSSATGSGNGIGSIARRIEFRRFALDSIGGLRVGDRVVVGVDDRSLLKASATAYALPLLAALGAGGIAQSMFGDDLITMMSTAAGLIGGLFIARLAAGALGRRGELAPRFLRHADGTFPPKSPCGDLPPGGMEALGAARRASVNKTCGTGI